MIRFPQAPEPPGFHERVRVRGNAWLKEHPTGRPRDYWREFTPQLREGFRGLCGYSAMWIQSGDVDHFDPCVSNRALAYEWRNYRYADGMLNSKKQGRAAAEMLDPFEVEDDWFEVILPSLQLVVTDRCPEGMRGRARAMLDALGLGHSDWVIDIRRSWYDLWQTGELSLDGLEKRAPLVARAIRKRQGVKR